MALKFSPNGFLDIATDSSELPSQISGKDETSGAMRRCTNLHLDKMGIASTRKGSRKINTTALTEKLPALIVEQSGNRHLFSGSDIYKNEVSLGASITEGYEWTAVKYNAFNSLAQSIFCTNGVEQYRIENGTIYKWGVDIPGDVPTIEVGSKTGLTGSYNIGITYTRKEGDTVVSETNLSDPAIANLTLTNQSLRIKVYPSDDPQVSSMRLYRTDMAGVDYYFLREFSFAPVDRDYAYIYAWEESDGYISGTGYLFVTDVLDPDRIDMISCDSLSDSNGVWSFIGDIGLSLETAEKKEGSASLKISFNSSGLSIIKYTKNANYWDLSSYNTLYVWLYSSIIIGSVYLHFGESAYNEQSTSSFSLSAGWTQKTWDISGIAAADRNSVKYFGITPVSGLADEYLLVDQIYADVGTYSYQGKQKIYGWEPTGTTSESQVMSLYPWEPVIIDDNTADSSLGTEPPDDHDVPPFGNFIFGPSYTGLLFMLKDNLLHYSLEKQPEYWPVAYYLEISPKDFPLMAGCFFDGQTYVATSDEIYQILGTGHSSWSPPIAMSAITGTVSKKCFLGVHGQGIFHLGNDGLYLYSGTQDQNVTHEKFKPIFEGITVGSIPGIDQTNISNCWLIAFKNKLYFGYPESGSTYPDNMIVTDLKTGRTVHYDYGQTFPAVGIDYTNDQLLAADTSGYLWEIEDESESDDNGTVISWQIETKEYQETLRKYFPRWARYDVNLNNGATANGYILLNGVSKQTHAITESRQTKKRLITGCTGDRLSMRITGTGVADIYSAEVD